MAFPDRPLRLGTRGSPLALAQARMTAQALCATHGWEESAIETVIVQTSGDLIQDRALAEIGGKALWTKELDRALADGRIDCAVHSMKDVETIRPEEITIAAMLPRADICDRLLGADSFASLPENPVVGTSSPRRSAQIKRLRPDARIILFRGNVATRMAKLEAGEANATLLAAAGLNRLGQTDVGVSIPIDIMLPAPAQGAVGIETLRANERVIQWLNAISDADTFDCVMMERALLLGLGGTCHSPIAAFAHIEQHMIHLRAQIFSEDGADLVEDQARFDRHDKYAAQSMGQSLLQRAPDSIRSLFET